MSQNIDSRTGKKMEVFSEEPDITPASTLYLYLYKYRCLSSGPELRRAYIEKQLKKVVLKDDSGVELTELYRTDSRLPYPRKRKNKK